MQLVVAERDDLGALRRPRIKAEQDRGKQDFDAGKACNRPGTQQNEDQRVQAAHHRHSGQQHVEPARAQAAMRDEFGTEQQISLHPL